MECTHHTYTNIDMHKRKQLYTLHKDVDPALTSFRIPEAILAFNAIPYTASMLI